MRLGESICIWGGQKQAAVALSTCESEYYALTLAAKEAIWVRRVLVEAGVYIQEEIKQPVAVFSDNQSAIKWATGERPPSTRAKHIDVKVHFIRDLVKDNVVSVEYVASEKNDADALTKPLGPNTLKMILERISFGGAVEEEC